jgi:hypothetical protein
MHPCHRAFILVIANFLDKTHSINPSPLTRTNRRNSRLRTDQFAHSCSQYLLKNCPECRLTRTEQFHISIVRTDEGLLHSETLEHPLGVTVQVLDGQAHDILSRRRIQVFPSKWLRAKGQRIPELR